MTVVRLPNGWRPRPYQMRLWRYLERGGKRAVAVWHRRAGKDEVGLHRTAVAAFERVGVYWHMLPEAAQARKAIWEAVNPHTGLRRIDEAFPEAVRADTRSTDMFIRFVNGSTWQVVGSDNFNSLVGSPPVGIVFSEYSLAKPSAWDFLRPILAENGGWALFIYTARGRNHGHALYEVAKSNPSWFAELLTVDDTRAIGPEVIAEERASGMSEDMIQQEYYCSFEAAIPGSYYGHLINAAEREGRIGDFPHDPRRLVHTCWDLGWSDDTAIWFYQVYPDGLRWIDYYAAHGQPVEHYAEALHARPYRYGDHWVPHDAKPKTLASGGRSIVEQAFACGLNMRLTPNLGVQDGIQAVRLMLPRCWFDAEKCKDGIEALRQYHREWDQDRRAFKDSPAHDWSSHAADAFRYGAVAYRAVRPPAPPPAPPRGVMQMTWNEAAALLDREQSERRRI